MTEQYDITLRNRDGKVVPVDSDRFILEQLEEAGLRHALGCRWGGCVTCAAVLVEGQVDHSDGRAFALRPEHEQEGYVLLCVAKAKSDCVIDVGDVNVRRKLYVNQFRDGGRIKPASRQRSGIRKGDSGNKQQETRDTIRP